MSRVIRGVDWFVFGPTTIGIQEVRPYVASLPHGDNLRYATNCRTSTILGVDIQTETRPASLERLALQPSRPAAYCKCCSWFSTVARDHWSRPADRERRVWSMLP